MYAIMDGFLENLPHIIDMDHPGGNANLTPVQMAYFAEPASIQDKIRVQKVGGKAGPEKKRKELEDLKTELNDLRATGSLPDITKKLDNLRGARYIADKPAATIALQKDQLDFIVKAIEKAIADHDKVIADGEGAVKRAVLSFEAGGPKSILEMVYDIAEIATAKYDYNMRGDDFKFTMSVVHYSFNALNEKTHGDTFALTSERVQAGIEDIMGLNRYDRLTRLEASITAEALAEAPRAAFKQTIFLAKLMAIHDEMRKEILDANSTDERITAIQVNTVQHRRLVDQLQMAELSPTLSAGVQRILLQMRTLLEDG